MLKINYIYFGFIILLFLIINGCDNNATGNIVYENINENEVIIVRNDEIITKDAKLNENDRIELLCVISGG